MSRTPTTTETGSQRRALSIALMLAIAVCGLLGCERAAAEGDGDCLDDPQAWLVIGDGQRIAMRPGAGGELTISCRRGSFMNEPVEGKVTWRLDPPSAGTLDKSSGRFTLAPGIAVGSKVMVHVELTPPSGRKRQAQAEILVIDPAPQPWVGILREVGQVPCPGAKPAAEAELIQEFELREDGTFAVTWHPFERYKDYWGTYAVDRNSGALQLAVTGGNDVPEGLDLDGTLRWSNGEMVLESIYLGSKTKGAPPVCGHRFQ